MFSGIYICFKTNWKRVFNAHRAVVLNSGNPIGHAVYQANALRINGWRNWLQHLRSGNRSILVFSKMNYQLAWNPAALSCPAWWFGDVLIWVDKGRCCAARFFLHEKEWINKMKVWCFRGCRQPVKDMKSWRQLCWLVDRLMWRLLSFGTTFSSKALRTLVPRLVFWFEDEFIWVADAQQWFLHKLIIQGGFHEPKFRRIQINTLKID